MAVNEGLGAGLRWQTACSDLIATLLSIELHLLAISNSLRWFVHSILKIPEHLFENAWQNLVEKFATQDDQMTFLVSGTLLVSVVVYWVWGGFYVLLDLTGWLSRYKVQPGTNQPLDQGRLVSTILRVIFNQTIVSLPAAVIAFYLAKFTGRLLPFRDLIHVPPFSQVLLEMPLLILCHEFAFYYSHRLLHQGWLYKTIHKRHHQWTAPIAVVAVDCHPLEHVLANIGPVLLGPALLGSHPLTAWFWFAYVTFQTLNGHSGYHWPWFQSPEFHDFHHLKFNCNFGSIGFLDHLHGTDSLWRKSDQFGRHVVLSGLQPAVHNLPQKIK
ncbi:fatty acid hydroxylase domain-containing protein 2-like [Neocloeon triangulifer]|uniref:fatty acid hydroxylase domain-containing protein 2-like n=1 Tax=Neocloeon triangulifer TaxID=2078957 RepID=UPI00286FA663|nr:fatty acid hydroxylase domain-containing protein 2-like [Neocloeon triangulifer]